ncbi:hypothetical protein HYS50_00650 [Candidatus Woesearchaeota archaeon]|nr:hypothetical protein [Candidatus Woesearchaeota archaeon]
MVKDNSPIYVAIGTICLIAGVLWTLYLGAQQQINYLLIAITSILTIVGIFILVFMFRS